MAPSNYSKSHSNNQKGIRIAERPQTVMLSRPESRDKVFDLKKIDHFSKIVPNTKYDSSFLSTFILNGHNQKSEIRIMEDTVTHQKEIE